MLSLVSVVDFLKLVIAANSESRLLDSANVGIIAVTDGFVCDVLSRGIFIKLHFSPVQVYRATRGA